MLVRKKFKFEAAHRLTSSYSKRCQSFHGHSYVVEVVLFGENLNLDGMVLDFGELKDHVSEFIDRFDHSMILHDEDPVLDAMTKIMDYQNMRYIVTPYNPTAENMAQHFMNYISETLHDTYPLITVQRVTVHETKTGWATSTSWNGNLRHEETIFSKAVLGCESCTK